MKHGHKKRGQTSPEYKTWLGMKRRCYDVRFKDYPNWGGKGIRVCDEWNKNFVAFFAYMGPKPTPLHTIDRLDSKKDYAPGNCRWATPQEQGSENREGLKSINVKGIEFRTITAACAHFGVRHTTVNERLKAGIDLDTAFSPGRLPSRRDKQSYWRKALRS